MELPGEHEREKQLLLTAKACNMKVSSWCLVACLCILEPGVAEWSEEAREVPGERENNLCI